MVTKKQTQKTAKQLKFEALCKKARSNFFVFCQMIVAEDDFQPFARFQKYICDSIQYKLDNEDFGIREMFSVPPGYGKSTLLSQLLVAYLLGVDPEYKIMLISYGSELSNRNGRYAKQIMDKPIYKRIFPKTRLIGIRANPPYDTTAGGGIRCIGRGGAITGFRADFILIDDVLKGPEEAASKSTLKSLYDWYPTVVNTRLKPNGGIIILATRWCRDDLIGWLLRLSGNWNYTNLEAICTNKEKDPLNREIGEALWPEYKSYQSLYEARQLNEDLFQIVYQGNCEVELRKVIKIDRVQYEDKVPWNDGYTVLCYDTAATRKSWSDYTVVTIWAVSKDLERAILVDLVRGKYDFNDIIKLHDELDYIHKPNTTIIENKSSGVQLIQMKQKQNRSLYASKGINSDLKQDLAELLNNYTSYGQITFLSHLKHNTYLLKELAEFPYGEWDDIVLSILHFIKWFSLKHDAKKTIVSRARQVDFKDLTRKISHLGKKYKRAKKLSLPFNSSFN